MTADTPIPDAATERLARDTIAKASEAREKLRTLDLPPDIARQMDNRLREVMHYARRVLFAATGVWEA